jgi:hypothetical protein
MLLLQNFGYFMMVVGYVWFCLFMCTYVCIKLYPKNYFNFAYMSIEWLYTLNLTGCTLGLDCFFFGIGLNLTLKLMKYDTFMPKEAGK